MHPVNFSGWGMLRRLMLRPPAERSEAGEDRGTDVGGRTSLKLFHVFDFQRNVLASKKSFSPQDFVAFD